jgi:putative transposase
LQAARDARPVLAVGDSALRFWKTLRDVFADTKQQRCRWHTTGNVLAALPKSAHKHAKAALAEIYNAEDRDHAEQAVKAFAAAYGAKRPKAVAKITNDLDVLLAFYDFPAEHWIHLRTTNPIESTFATVRLRQRVTKGPARGPPGSRWRSNSSSRHSTAGVPSIPPTSSRWSEPARSSRTVSSRTTRRTSTR